MDRANHWALETRRGRIERAGVAVVFDEDESDDDDGDVDEVQSEEDDDDAARGVEAEQSARPAWCFLWKEKA